MAATQVDKAQVPSKGQGVEKQEDLITIGCRVKLKEMPMIQDYVNRIYNQFVADPNTKEQRTCDQTCNFFIYDSI
jgi:exosome complex RNA-binding protein Rrp42 (RNase PH superfamily)